LGCDFVWINGLKCKQGHDIAPQSKARFDYRGYPSNAVPLDVAEDLRDKPFPCFRCPRPEDPTTPTTLYFLRFLATPRTLCNCPECPSCGEQVVALELGLIEVRAE